MPILGSIPGIGGIINLMAGTLNNVLSGLPILGPIMGGLILSPHPSASAQGLGNGTSSSLGHDFFLDASSSRNATTIYMVDSGHPSPFAISSQSNNANTTSERIVSLQMAFVNSTSGQVQAYCATFNDVGQGPVALAAKACISDGVTNVPHPSQSFGYNPLNQAVRPMWDDGASKEKRAYVVQAGSSAGEPAVGKMDVGGGDGSDKTESVVLVFKAFDRNSANAAEPTVDGQSSKDATGAGAAGNGGEAPTAPPSAPEDPKPAVEAVEDYGVPVFISGLDSSATA
jgi:hypothetical protein